jgi:hypothetical protein
LDWTTARPAVHAIAMSGENTYCRAFVSRRGAGTTAPDTHGDGEVRGDRALVDVDELGEVGQDHRGRAGRDEHHQEPAAHEHGALLATTH